MKSSPNPGALATNHPPFPVRVPLGSVNREPPVRVAGPEFGKETTASDKEHFRPSGRFAGTVQNATRNNLFFALRPGMRYKPNLDCTRAGGRLDHGAFATDLVRG